MSKATKVLVLKEVYNQLLAEGKVESQNNFAEQLKYHPSPVSAMMRGQKPMPYKFLEALYKTFNVNINFIISKGAGSMFLGQAEMISKKDIDASIEAREKHKALEKELQDLRQRLADKEEIIHLLKKSNS